VNAAELAAIGGDPPAAHPAVPWGRLARSRNLAALCAMYFGAIYGWYFYLTWLPTYLLRARGFDLTAVGWLAALPLLGIATGSLVGGFLADVLTRRWGAASACAPRRDGLRSPRSRSWPPCCAGSAHQRVLLAAAAGSPRSASRPAGPSASRSAAATPGWCRGR
jgi:MFS family permease